LLLGHGEEPKGKTTPLVLASLFRANPQNCGDRVKVLHSNDPISKIKTVTTKS